MWLDARKICHIGGLAESPRVRPWRVDVRVLPDEPPEEPPEGGDDSFIVGRIQACEMPIERGEYEESEALDDADGHSELLEAAFAALLDEHGGFLDGYESVDTLVVIERYELHGDFAEWRLAILHAFCGEFWNDTAIIIPASDCPLIQSELKDLGFRLLPQRVYQASPFLPMIDYDSRFYVRLNSELSQFTAADYPGEWTDARAEHQEWIESLKWQKNLDD